MCHTYGGAERMCSNAGMARFACQGTPHSSQACPTHLRRLDRRVDLTLRQRKVGPSLESLEEGQVSRRRGPASCLEPGLY